MSCVYFWVIKDRSRTDYQNIHLTNLHGTATAMQKSTKKTGCLQAFVSNISGRWDATRDWFKDPREHSRVFLKTLHSSAMDTIGPTPRKHQSWFDENCKEIKGFWKTRQYEYDFYSVSEKAVFASIHRTPTWLSSTVYCGRPRATASVVVMLITHLFGN